MMINNIFNVPKDKCTGCGACVNICPKNIITMKYDKEGFIYPQVDGECINCGVCLNVCPALKKIKLHNTPKSFAVWANDDIRSKSSSGGMFTLMAEYVLEHNGAVCGAVYAEDYQTVYHAWANTKEELDALRGSKYLQSDTKNTYKEAKKFLDNGRMVLYTGCPCQIAGLYAYLGKDYDNLYTADLICHGSNSVFAYQSFLKEFAEGKKIKKVAFRDKKMFKWISSFVAYYEDGTYKKDTRENRSWYKGFLNGVINRLCCYECNYAKAERIADITLGDCWEIHRINRNYDDKNGTSLVLINSEKGKILMGLLEDRMKLCQEIPLSEIRKYNGQLNKPTKKHIYRDVFFTHLKQFGYNKALKYALGERFDIGIVGWWFATNYGSSLTYFALGTVLKKLNKQILFVPITKIDGTPWEKECLEIISFISEYFRIGKNRDFDKMIEFNSFCDAFMLGSDQMWRAGTINLVGYSFFLDFVNKDKKKIAFSSSFGGEVFSDNGTLCDTVRDFLKRFDAISVREKSGIDICKKYFNIDVQQIIDPVFLLNRSEYDRILENIEIELPDKKYLLCYILDPSPEKEIAVKKFAENHNLDLLVIFGMREYAKAQEIWHSGKVLPKVNVKEFLYYIKHCDYLITDSHHGTCFAIIYHKQYIAMVNQKRGGTRFETIADLLNLNSRLVYNISNINNNDKFYEDINWSDVEFLINKEKDRALLWLNEALNKKTINATDTINTIRVDNERKYYGLNNRVLQLNKKLANSIELLTEYKNLQMDIAKLRKEVRKEVYRNKLEYIKNKINGGIRCYQDNGLKYTINRIIFKIKNKLS